jgi:hypothetical protein
MPELQLSATAKVVILETADIGGTNTDASGNWATWHDMRDFDRVYAMIEVGTWNATDDLDECRLQQATDSSGTGAKDLTTDASGGNYDTDNPVDADGDFVILEARAEDLDLANGFRYVRAYVAEGGNTGVDNVSGVLIFHGATTKRKQQNGAAVTGSKVYVTP